MNKGSALAIRRKLASRSIFETFNNRLDRCQFRSRKYRFDPTDRFPRSIIPDNQRQRRVKLDCFAASVVEGADATKIDQIHSSSDTKATKLPKNGQLVDFR